jgi:hypothetical protein
MKKHFCETCSGRRRRRRRRRFSSTQKRIKQSYRDHQLMFQGFLVLFCTWSRSTVGHGSHCKDGLVSRERKIFKTMRSTMRVLHQLVSSTLNLLELLVSTLASSVASRRVVL